jgi:cellulose synthase/poly-beta-1,6-N-acetylglucosamine synthase-like glycosyltransferase
MSIFVLLNMLGFFLALLTLPLVLELAVLTLASLLPLNHKKTRPASAGQLPLTVLIPAHNEEALIGRCVRSVLAAGAVNIDLLVIAHNCTDRTADEAKAAGARVLVLDSAKESGKGYALRFGFGEALKGASIGTLVVDADSEIDPDLIAEIRERFLHGSRALQCRYDVLNTKDTPRTRLMKVAFLGFNVIRPRGRARLGLSSGIFGNGFALHRDLLEHVPFGAFSIVEDIEYHLKLVEAGERVDFIDNAAVHGEIPVGEEGSRTQRARWEGGRIRAMYAYTPRLLKGIARGHLRLLEPLLDLLALPLVWEIVLLLLAAALPLAWLRFYVIASLAVLIGHVLAAAAAAPGFWSTVGSLAAVPGYVLWKLRMVPEILRRARPGAAWKRTERSAMIEMEDHGTQAQNGTKPST